MRIKVPPLHHHRASGRARVSYRGKHYYFGVWGRVETEQAYRRWAAEFVSSGGVELEAVDELPVSALVAHYLNYTRTYYPPTSSMHDIIGRALAPVVNLYGNVPVSEFGPKQLMAVRGVWLYPEHGRALARATVASPRRSLTPWARCGSRSVLLAAGRPPHAQVSRSRRPLRLARFL